MRAPIEVETILPLEALEAIYRNAQTKYEQQHAQIVLLRFEKMPPAEVARIVRVTQRTVTRCVNRFNSFGPDGLIDARSNNKGRTPLLDESAQVELLKLIESPPRTVVAGMVQK